MQCASPGTLMCLLTCTACAADTLHATTVKVGACPTTTRKGEHTCTLHGEHPCPHTYHSAVQLPQPPQPSLVMRTVPPALMAHHSTLHAPPAPPALPCDAYSPPALTTHHGALCAPYGPPPSMLSGGDLPELWCCWCSTTGDALPSPSPCALRQAGQPRPALWTLGG